MIYSMQSVRIMESLQSAEKSNLHERCKQISLSCVLPFKKEGVCMALLWGSERIFSIQPVSTEVMQKEIYSVLKMVCFFCNHFNFFNDCLIKVSNCHIKNYTLLFVTLFSFKLVFFNLLNFLLLYSGSKLLCMFSKSGMSLF